jgi:peptide/nickel transport system substrate-binding protein
LPDKNGDGMRLLPGGEPLAFQVMATPDYMPKHVEIVNLVTGYWKAVGVNAELSSVSRSLLYTRKESNEHDAVVWIGDGGLQDAILEPRWYFPSTGESNFGYAWYLWYQNPPEPQAKPMEPPEEAKRQMDLYDEIEATADPEAQTELFNELLGISIDMLYAIGVSLPSPGYGIKKLNLRNVPPVMPDASLYPTPAPSNPQQWWFDE